MEKNPKQNIFPEAFAFWFSCWLGKIPFKWLGSRFCIIARFKYKPKKERNWADYCYTIAGDWYNA